MGNIELPIERLQSMHKAYKKDMEVWAELLRLVIEREPPPKISVDLKTMEFHKIPNEAFTENIRKVLNDKDDFVKRHYPEIYANTQP